MLERMYIGTGRQCGKSVLEKSLQIREIERVGEADGWTPTMRKQHKRLHDQMYNPTPRQQVVGFKPGRLSESEERDYRVQICIKKLNDYLDKELRGQNG